MDPLALGRHLDRDDLLEHLDAALHLRGLRRLVAEAVDEHLHARDFFVLLALRLAQPLDARVALDEVVAVVADVVGQRAQVRSAMRVTTASRKKRSCETRITACG